MKPLENRRKVGELAARPASCNSVSAAKPAAIVEPCPIRDVLDRIGDQWSLLVLEALGTVAVVFAVTRGFVWLIMRADKKVDAD